MAQRISIIDDLTGEEGAELFTFSINGDNREIDITPANKQKFMDAIDEFVSASRKGKATPVKRTTNGSGGNQGGAGQGLDFTGMTQAESRAFTREVRDWARENGWPKLSDRGRIPSEVVDAWDLRSSSLPADPPTEQPEEEEEEETDDTSITPPLPPVSDAEIVQWAKTKKYKVVANKCTANLRTRYRTENEDRVLEYDIKNGAATA